MSRFAQAFKLAGLWPSGGVSDALVDVGPGHNLLPVLCAAWRQASSQESAGRERSLFIADRLAKLCGRGAALTNGIPGIDPNAVSDWIGSRIAFWPDGIPKQRRVGLLSSHLGRELELRSTWFSFLRAACTKINSADDLLVTTKTVTADRFVRRCHELFGIRLLDIQLPKDDESLCEWGEGIRRVEFESISPGVSRLVLSPEFGPLTVGTLQGSSNKTERREGEAPTEPRVPADLARQEPRSPASETASGVAEPLADRAIVALSQKLIVLSLRPRGRLLPLIERRIQDNRWAKASVIVALGTDLVASDVAEPLLGDGAVGWLLLDTLKNGHDAGSGSMPDAEACSQAKPSRQENVAPIISIPDPERWRFLTHCTRRIDGPWPEQGEDDYLDDLILEREAGDHSVFASILRILQQRRIVASSAAIRGGTPVVSLTAVPLADIPRMRIFRSHRTRWDFEPYGICIDRDWLAARGARPVTYGDEQTWRALADKDRPFFQVGTTNTKDAPVIDWTSEREWRHLGNVDLSSIPADAALVFVPTEQEASELADKSPWPIVVLAREKPPHSC